MNPLCKLLEWDTSFFGFRVARIVDNKLTPATAQAAIDWSLKEKITCLYFLADFYDPETVCAAEAAGFGLKDVRMTYGRNLTSSDPLLNSKPEDGLLIRTARDVDVPDLEDIAKDAYLDSRFFF